MFHHIFYRRRTVARHAAAPYAEERERYLAESLRRGEARVTVKRKAEELYWVAYKLNVYRDLRLTLDQVRAAALDCDWKDRERAYGRKLNRRSTREQFVDSARRWLRYLGYQFIATHSPEHVAWCTDIRNVAFKKTAQPVIPYLEKPEIDAVLDSPDRQARLGIRDYALLLFLYNTGARADEAARLAIRDATWGRSAAVRLLGKGNKTRQCPLWPKTAEILKELVGVRAPQERVFLNRLGQPLTRFGIYALVRRAVTKAARNVPSLRTKRISPHCVRHSSACHLLRSGVDINTIRAWLGHSSLATTNVYAEVDLEMKAKALARTDLKDKVVQTKRWRKSPNLLEFLKGI